MHTNLVILFRVAFVLILVAGFAMAGPLPTDPNAIPGWQGSAPFNAVLGGSSLVTNVEFAVYAPGQFSTSAALGFPGHVPLDPSGGTDYVYAYEIINVGGNSKALTLSVGLDYLGGAVPTSPTSITDDPGTPALGVPPSTPGVFNPAVGIKQNARWSWATIGGLVVGANSDILIFSSPFGPQMWQSTVTGTGGPQTPLGLTLPSPTPEPASVALALIGGAGLLAFARRFRRRVR